MLRRDPCDKSVAGGDRTIDDFSTVGVQADTGAGERQLWAAPVLVVREELRPLRDDAPGPLDTPNVVRVAEVQTAKRRDAKVSRPPPRDRQAVDGPARQHLYAPYSARSRRHSVQQLCPRFIPLDQHNP